METARTREEHTRRRLDQADRIRDARLVRAEAAVKAAEERVDYARRNWERSSTLFDRGLVSHTQLEDSQRDLALLERELDVARADLLMQSDDQLTDVQQDLAVTERQVAEAGGRLALLRAGSRPERIEALEAEIARLETRGRNLAERLRLTTVVSPVTGIVTTPKIRDRVGELVRQGDLIAKVHETDGIVPEVVISERDIADVAPGQRVVLKARAYPDRSFEGTVKAIAPEAVQEAGLARQGFRVMIAAEDRSGLLKPEMTGSAKIDGGQRPLIELATRRFARYLRVEFWSWW